MRIKDLANLPIPEDIDELAIEDISANQTKKITRENFFVGSPLPPNSIDTQSIQNLAITTEKVDNASITNAKTDFNFQSEVVFTSQTRTSVGYGALATVGPAVSVTTTKPNQKFLLILRAFINNSTTAYSYMGYDAGATLGGAVDVQAIEHYGNVARRGHFSIIANIPTAGTYTFTSVYRVSAGTGTFSDRYIQVILL